jgi:hypothetical protein
MAASAGDKCAVGVWANRMVCGYCSTEQPYQKEKCVGCGHKLAGGGGVSNGRGGAQFWEGGAGCRNRSMLNKNDAKKWTNSKLKTRSHKEGRVGEEGKQRREANVAKLAEIKAAKAQPHHC